uniref:Uncharacterized protein n=1 Tax=Romanomermis culicivorax TaxID=13658 RepID=A0A915L0Z8_ROMCU
MFDHVTKTIPTQSDPRRNSGSNSTSLSTAGRMLMNTVDHPSENQSNVNIKTSHQNQNCRQLSSSSINGTVCNDFSQLSAMDLSHRPYTRSLKRSLGALGAELLDQFNTGLQLPSKNKRSKKDCAQ